MRENTPGKKNNPLIKAMFSIFLVLLGGVASRLLKDVPILRNYLNDIAEVTWGHTATTKVLDSRLLGGATVKINDQVVTDSLFLNEVIIENSGDVALEEFGISLVLIPMQNDCHILGDPAYEIVNDDTAILRIREISSERAKEMQLKDHDDNNQNNISFEVACLNPDQKLKVTVLTDQEVSISFRTDTYKELKIDTFEDIKRRKAQRAILWGNIWKYSKLVFVVALILLIITGIIISIREDREEETDEESPPKDPNTETLGENETDMAKKTCQVNSNSEGKHAP